MDQLRLILLIMGVAAIILIYVWGMRAHIQAKLKERRRRAAARAPENEPVLDEQGHLPGADGQDRPLGDIDTGQVSPDSDPFAHQRLVDVEITPIKRPPSETVNQEAPSAISNKPAITETADKSVEKSPKGPTEAGPARKPAKEEASTEPEKVVLLTVMAPKGQPFRGRNIAKVAEELDLKLSDSGVYECLADSDKRKAKPVFGIASLLEPGTFDPDAMEVLSTPGLLMFMRLPTPVESMAAMELLLTTARQLAQRLGGTVCDDRRNKLTTQAIMHLKSEITEFERRRRIWAHQQHG